MILLAGGIMDNVWAVMSPALLIIIGGIVTWFLSRRTKGEELKSLELKNTALIIEQEQKNASYWQAQAAKKEEMYEKLLNELLTERQLRKTYENEVQQLRIEVSELKAEVNMLRTIYETNSK